MKIFDHLEAIFIVIFAAIISFLMYIINRKDKKIGELYYAKITQEFAKKTESAHKKLSDSRNVTDSAISRARLFADKYRESRRKYNKFITESESESGGLNSMGNIKRDKSEPLQ